MSELTPEETAAITTVHRIWYPLYDHPITIKLSREQLQGIQDALLGRMETVAGWGAWFARTEIERVLKESIATPSAAEPTGADS